MKLTLQVWRQENTGTAGGFARYEVLDADGRMSLLELLDMLNETLVAAGVPPVAFDSDCREGVCGACGITVDDRPHGPLANTPTCRQHLRSFADGAVIKLEPFRSAAFPVLRDLVVDRSALDRLIEAGGFVSVDAGTAPDADSQQIPHSTAVQALDYAACIGCGACVAACPNSSAQLYAGSKLLHLSLLNQGGAERGSRAHAITRQLDAEFGPCSTYGECATVCPAGIPLTAIAAVPKESLRFWVRSRAD